ncbi:MAG TPA: hypothetical protein VH765_09960 [Xanthobacteraceae bacterium]|jgi:hypothetical protein
MWNFSIATSISLVLRTYLFTLIRAAVYFGIAAAFVVAAGGGAGVGWAVGSLAGITGRAPGAFWGAIGGLAVVALMLRGLREYLLFLVRAGHDAALLLALQRADDPAQGQIGQALGLVQQRFREIGTLFAVERAVQGTVAALIAILDPTRKLLPGGIQLAAALNPLLAAALKHLTDVVLVRSLRGRKSPWLESRDALVLLAQAHEAIIRDALVLAACAYAATFVVFLLALVPASALAQAYPGGTAPIALLFAAIFAWSFKLALIEPLVVASTLQAYFGATERQSPDPEWDAKLTEASEHFRELRVRGLGARRGRSIVSA